MSASTPDTLPSPPRLVLRVGFAGRKELSEAETTRLETSLREVLEILGHRLAALAPGVPVDTGKEPPVSGFFAKQCPLLRLVTGLCEGADARAARVLETVRVTPDAGPPDAKCLETELAAVLPFSVETYRRSRPAEFQAEFDAQLARCAWVLELDGIYDKPNPPTLLADYRRARAYRAQSAFLLRHSDLLIAAANPDAVGKAGGTLETVREALAFDLPVIFIHTGKESDRVYLIDPEDDFHSVLAENPPTPVEWGTKLREWVTRVTANNDLEHGHDKAHDEARKYAEAILQEFFHCPESPARDARKGMFRIRKWAWATFERGFSSGPKPKSDTPLAPYEVYRQRATSLSRHYSGLYRGTFLLNYLFAVLAVGLATLSLALFASFGHDEPPWLMPTILGLTAVKLGLVIFISRNTRKANDRRWNDRAVDFRYLAERLRGMYYLPRAGSHQPPATAPGQFSSRAVRQSAVDWLFDSIVRAISPADLPLAQPSQIPSHDGRGVVKLTKLVRLQPVEVVKALREGWIGEQAKYHEGVSRTMQALHHTTEQWAKFVGLTVAIVVGIDLFLILGEKSFLHDWEHTIKPLTPWLILLSAVLPAFVAALGGIRFQSECQRLAERSGLMHVMLAGRGQDDGCSQRSQDLAKRIAERIGTDTDPGSWSHEVLRLTERVATDFVHEAAEWPVLYAKEVSDPG